MARRFFQLAIAAALIHTGILTTPCHAQTPAAQPSASPAASPSPGASEGKGEKHKLKFSREALTPDEQKKYDSMPPDQQANMRENWERWQNMTPEQRRAYRAQQEENHRLMMQEIDEAIKESGLQLNDQEREEYVKRYTQERRKIERNLQTEMDKIRRPLVKALIEQLKAEFQEKSSPSPSPETSSSPAPAAISLPSK